MGSSEDRLEDLGRRADHITRIALSHDALSLDQWRAWLSRWENNTHEDATTAWKALPEPLVLEVAGRHVSDVSFHNYLAIAWKRFPDSMQGLADQEIRAGNLDYTLRAPAAAILDAVAAALGSDALPPETRERARQWLLSLGRSDHPEADRAFRIAQGHQLRSL